MPFLSMMRTPLEDTRSFTHLFSFFTQKRRVCRLGKKRRRVLLCAWETLLPEMGRFPVTWHTRDMAVVSVSDAVNLYWAREHTRIVDRVQAGLAGSVLDGWHS